MLTKCLNYESNNVMFSWSILNAKVRDLNFEDKKVPQERFLAPSTFCTLRRHFLVTIFLVAYYLCNLQVLSFDIAVQALLS